MLRRNAPPRTVKTRLRSFIVVIFYHCFLILSKSHLFGFFFSFYCDPYSIRVAARRRCSLLCFCQSGRERERSRRERPLLRLSLDSILSVGGAAGLEP